MGNLAVLGTVRDSGSPVQVYQSRLCKHRTAATHALCKMRMRRETRLLDKAMVGRPCLQPGGLRSGRIGFQLWRPEVGSLVWLLRKLGAGLWWKEGVWKWEAMALVASSHPVLCDHLPALPVATMCP